MKCNLCSREDNNGIDLLGIHICKECEKDIVETNMDDIKYQYYRSVIKKLWMDYLIREVK